MRENMAEKGFGDEYLLLNYAYFMHIITKHYIFLRENQISEYSRFKLLLNCTELLRLLSKMFEANTTFTTQSTYLSGKEHARSNALCLVIRDHESGNRVVCHWMITVYHLHHAYL